MRIMIDTNVLLSTLVFKSAKMANLIEYIADKHTLVLCSYVIEEANAVITRKLSTYKAALDAFRNSGVAITLIAVLINRNFENYSGIYRFVNKHE